MGWRMVDKVVLHAFGAASPVTVMEVESLALVDEGAHTVLQNVSPD